MKRCIECKNKNICKWIEERDKIEVKLNKFALKKESPFSLECHCASFIMAEEEKKEVVEVQNVEDHVEHEEVKHLYFYPEEIQE